MVDQNLPVALQLNEANFSDTGTPFLDFGLVCAAFFVLVLFIFSRLKGLEHIPRNFTSKSTVEK